MFFPYPEDGVSCGSGLNVVYICHCSYFFLDYYVLVSYVHVHNVYIITFCPNLWDSITDPIFGLSLLSQLCLLCSLTIVFFNIYYFYNQAYYSFNFLNSKPLFIDDPHALFFYVAWAIKVCFLVHFATFFYLFFLSSYFFPEPDIEYLIKLYL